MILPSMSALWEERYAKGRWHSVLRQQFKCVCLPQSISTSAHASTLCKGESGWTVSTNGKLPKCTSAEVSYVLRINIWADVLEG